MANAGEVLRKPKAPQDDVYTDAARTVLVVDDEASVRNIMRRWLVSRGYLVSLAADAAKALEHLSTSPTAVALCDLNMPGRDGLWLADQLRREYPDTAVTSPQRSKGCAKASSTI
jgi:CheY-like chemotaxis protein